MKEKLPGANVLQKFSSRRISTTSIATRRNQPQIGLRLLSLQPGLEPGETLEFEYSVNRVAPELIDSLEVSVMWRTEGKGSEDIGVHMFQARDQRRADCEGAESTEPPVVRSARIAAQFRRSLGEDSLVHSYAIVLE